MPKVSILIPAYNGARFLGEALESVVCQTYDNYEAIIVDDGSTDHTKEIVERYVKRDPKRFRYIYQKNGGISSARNTAISHAEGEFYALLDADDIWYPTRLEMGVRVMQNRRDVGLVHANIERIYEDGTFCRIPKRRIKYLNGHIFNYIMTRKANLSCPTILFRRTCCDQVGVFDNNLNYLGCEDRELWLRIAKCFEVAYIDEVLAKYRMFSGSVSHQSDKMDQARLYVINKHCPNGENWMLRNETLAQVSREKGDVCLIEKDFNSARKYYLRALSLKPFALWTWVNLLKALLRLKVTLIAS